MHASKRLLAGLRLASNGKGRPHGFGQVRQLSATGYSSIVKRPTLTRTSKISLTALPVGIQRLASTSATPQDPTPLETDSSDAWMKGFEDVHTTASNSIEPYVGMLRDWEVSFGYGPTSAIQWALEHIHVYSGLPWAGSITLMVIMGRLMLLRPSLKGSDMAARMKILEPGTKQAQAKMAEARAKGDQQGMALATAEIKSLYKEAGVNPFSIFLPILYQAPMGFGIWKLTREMAHLHVPGFDTGGFLWFTNLTVPDPYFVLAAITPILLHLTMKRGGEMGSSQISPTMKNVMYYGLPAISGAVITQLPAATQIAFGIGSLYGYGQSVLFQNKAFREYVGIQPMAPRRKDAKGHDGPYKGTITMYQDPSGKYSAQPAEPEKSGSPFSGVTSTWNSVKKRTKEKSIEQEEQARRRAAQEYEDRRKVELMRRKGR